MNLNGGNFVLLLKMLLFGFWRKMSGLVSIEVEVQGEECLESQIAHYFLAYLMQIGDPCVFVCG